MSDDNRFRISASDDSSEEERRAAYAAFQKNQERREKRDRIISVFGKIVKAAAIVLGVGLSAFLVTSILLHFRVIREVSITMDAVEWQEGDWENAVVRTVTLSGEVQDYLITTDSAKLEFRISGYTPVVSKIESHNYVYISGKYGKHIPWNGVCIQHLVCDENEETVFCDGPWYDSESGIYFMYLLERTSQESFSYAAGEQGSLIAFGCTDAETAERAYRKAYEENRLQFSVWPPIPSSN